MTWSDDGHRWLVDDRPWLDEWRWSDVVGNALRLRALRAERALVPACTACDDASMLTTRDDEGRWFSLPCPTCEPEQYRAFVEAKR